MEFVKVENNMDFPMIGGESLKNKINTNMVFYTDKVGEEFNQKYNW